MTESTNADLVEDFYSALRTGDIDLFWRIQNDDVVYNISGHTPISGRMVGRANMEREILPHVFGALRMDSFRFATKWKIVCEDKRRIVVIMEADGFGVNGIRYDQRYVHMFEFRDGKIAEVWEFFDTALANAVMFTPEQNVPRSKHLGEFRF